MRFSFTDEQDMFRDTVRDLLANSCSPAAVRESADSADGRVPGLWSSLGEMGVLAVLAPEDVGGLGMNEIDLVRILEESGYAGLSEPLGEHAGVAVPALSEGGANELASAAAAGEITCTVGLTAGGPYVVGAATADVLVIERDAVLWAVPSQAVNLVAQPSVDYGRRLSTVGFDISAATPLESASVDLATDRAVLWAAAQCVGVSRRLLDATVEYVSQRQQFGKPVGSYQAVKHHLANVRIGIEFAAPLVYRAAWSVASPGVVSAGDRARDVSMAKAAASDATDRACRAALQCHGAIGYTIEYDLQLWLKRGWALSAAWGDARFHRSRVAAAIGL